MEGSESESAFDAQNLNPQRFINEILNSVDELVDGAFDFCHQRASEITAAGGEGVDRSEELARGIASLRHLTQTALDKRMDMWEKYCLRHCFTVPEGFLTKNQQCSSDGLLLQGGFSDVELDSQLNSLRNKLSVVGKESAELFKEINSLEKQSTFSGSYDTAIAETLKLYEENSVQEMFQEMGATTKRLHLKVEELKLKRREDTQRESIRKINSLNKDQHLANDLDKCFPLNGFSGRLEDFQEVANVLKNL